MKNTSNLAQQHDYLAEHTGWKEYTHCPVTVPKTTLHAGQPRKLHSGKHPLTYSPAQNRHSSRGGVCVLVVGGDAASCEVSVVEHLSGLRCTSVPEVIRIPPTSQHAVQMWVN